MLMQNVATFKNKHSPKVTFDLKGSTVNRAVKLSDKSVVDVMTKKYNLKDMNFL